MAGLKSQAKDTAAYTSGLGTLSLLYNENQQQQDAASEQAKNLTLLGLGSPGTYEQSYSDFAASYPGGQAALTAQQSDIYNTSANDLLKLQNMFPAQGGDISWLKGKSPAVLNNYLQNQLGISQGISGLDPTAVQQFLANPTTGPIQSNTTHAGKSGASSLIANANLPPIIDPTKYSTSVLNSPQGREVSYLTAQSDQLIRQQGPLWDQMSQSVLGPIYQGAAALQKQSAQQISEQIARGGSARRQGLGDALQMQNQEAINADRSNQLWNANLSLNQFAINNARSQLLFNQAWTSNLPGVRDAYNQAMTSLTDFMSSTIIPSMQNTAYKNYELVHQYDKNWTSTIIGGAITAVGAIASVIPGGQAFGLPLLAAGASDLAGAAQQAYYGAGNALESIFNPVGTYGVMPTGSGVTAGNVPDITAGAGEQYGTGSALYTPTQVGGFDSQALDLMLTDNYS